MENSLNIPARAAASRSVNDEEQQILEDVDVLVDALEIAFQLREATKKHGRAMTQENMLAVNKLEAALDVQLAQLGFK